MNFEVYTYFTIVLSGFVAVWTYRNKTKSETNISDFEYLGWSAFWGLIILISYQCVAKLIGVDPESLTKLFGNPFATGILMSILGLVGGFVFGCSFRDLKSKGYFDKI